MDFNLLSKTPVTILRKSLDAYALRHKATAKNIANVESQDYRPLRVNFEENLREMLHKRRNIVKVSNPRHLNVGKSLLEISESESKDLDKVNIEQEMAELAKTQIQFDFSARVLARMYQGIRASIMGQVR